jgi:hypothetical protein
MSKKYSRKKKINGGNIITRRSNRTRISTVNKLLNRHSLNLNRLHSTPKRQLHPKVSTTSKPSEENDFMKTYILYTYSNDKTSRDNVGINHPAMKHISVNDYMNSFDNAVSNLTSNVYKSKKEKEKEIRQSKHIWDQIQSVFNGPDVEATTRHNKTQQKQKQKTQKTPLRRHSIGGAAASAASPAFLVEEFNFSEETSGIHLNQRLTFEKLMKFIDLSSRASKPTWKNRVSIFMKYMFFDANEFTCQVGPDNTLTGSVPRDKTVTEYAFSISTSTYLRVPVVPHNSRRELTRGPPFTFLLGEVRGSVTSVRLVEIAPTLRMSSHNATSTIQFNVSMFKGRFDTMSNVQRRHYIYCIILFVIMHASERQLQTIVDDFNTEIGTIYLHLEAVVRITKHFSDRNGNDMLPYNLFFNRAAVQGNKVTPSDINMIFLDAILQMEDASKIEPAYQDVYDIHSDAYVGKILKLPVGYSNRYFEMLHYIYGKIINIEPNEDVFTFDIPHQLHQPHQLVDKLTIAPVGFQGDTEFAFYFALNNSDDVNFYTQGDSNVGIIKDDNKNAFFYRDINSSTVGFIPNGWFFQRWLSRQPTITSKPIMKKLPLSRKVWTVQSRTTIIRDKIMGYLSHLAYYPNDVIESVSIRFFNKTIQGNSFIYVGPFDKDPTYPLSTTNIDTYSRIHVWLKVIASGPNAGGELYVVTRGSKTGYDWDSADSDIQNGVLNSQRSLHMRIVLREVIEYLNACLTPRSVQGSPELRDALSQLRGKSIQIYSSGHSLGGYLSLSLAHGAFCMNLINGFSFRYISGIAHASRRRNRQEVISLNSYIIPIVFDPYVVSTPIMNAFSFLPYAHIHSCIDSDFTVDHPRNQVDQTVDIEDPHRLYPIRQSLDLIYDDVASAFFLAYLRKKHSIQHFYNTMGRFSIFHYKNVYNVFENFIYHDTYYFGPASRGVSDGRTSHNLSQIIGLVPEYIFSYMFQTNLLIRTPQGLDENQSLQAAHYTFPIPTSKKIVPSIQPYRGPTSLLRRSNYIRYDIQDVPSTESSCVSKISYAPGRSSYTVTRIEPQTKIAFDLKCITIFQTDIDDFINSPF